MNKAHAQSFHVRAPIEWLYIGRMKSEMSYVHQRVCNQGQNSRALLEKSKTKYSGLAIIRNESEYQTPLADSDYVVTGRESIRFIHIKSRSSWIRVEGRRIDIRGKVYHAIII